LCYGTADIIDVRYKMRDKKVLVTVDIKQAFSAVYEADLFGCGD
jgi:hypothetical protein